MDVYRSGMNQLMKAAQAGDADACVRLLEDITPRKIARNLFQ